MRSIGPVQSRDGLALTEIFGSKGHVELLRILTTETDGSVASPEVAARLGMTPSGARKALRRLALAGVVEKVGEGRSTRYALKAGGELTEEIIRLFELERKCVEPGWGRAGGRAEPFPRYEGSAGDDGSSEGVKGNGAKKPGGVGGNGGGGDRRDVDPDTREFQEALVSLLEQDLSLIRRARQKVMEKLAHRHPGNGHDLWEWRKILDTYPLPRLLNFLDSDSPRAVRLRQSSPFPEVMSEEERERLGKLAERIH